MAAPSITVFKGRASWMANFRGARPSLAADTWAAFESYDVPLPWGIGAEGIRVGIYLANRYPDHVVEVRGAAGLRLNARDGGEQ